MFQLLPEPFGQDARDILARMLGNKQLKTNLVRPIIKGSRLIQCSGSILFRCGCGSGSASAFKKWIRILVIDISSLRFFSIFAYFYDTIFNIFSFFQQFRFGVREQKVCFLQLLFNIWPLVQELWIHIFLQIRTQEAIMWWIQQIRILILLSPGFIYLIDNCIWTSV